jgi:hypothetical protein
MYPLHYRTHVLTKMPDRKKRLTNYLANSEYYMRGHHLCSHSIASQHIIEPEGSLPDSKELSICPHPQLDQSSPVYLSRINLNINHPPMSLVFLVVSFPLVFPPIIYMRSSYPRPCYMHCPSHPPRLDHSNYTWGRVLVTNLLVMQFSPPFCNSSLFVTNILLIILYFSILLHCIVQ